MSICHICGKDISKTNYCERCNFTPKRSTIIPKQETSFQPVKSTINCLLQSNAKITAGNYDQAKKLLEEASQFLKQSGKTELSSQAFQLSQRLDEDNYNQIRNEVVSILRALGYV